MQSLLDHAARLQNLLVTQASGGNESDSEYRALRERFLADAELASLLTSFVATSHSVFQFGEFIQSKFPTYRERRQFIREAFAPLMSRLVDVPEVALGLKLESFDAENVYAAWSKILERRHRDPDGAIVLARLLIESICKYILGELGQSRPNGAELSRLFGATAEILNLSPSQYTDPVLKQLLGGCVAVAEALEAPRTQDQLGARLRPHHVELALNLAGAVAMFLIATWDTRKQSRT